MRTTFARMQNPKGPRRRPRRLRSLSFLPTLMTLGNLLCGFAAIHFALRAMYELGAGIPADSVASFHRSVLDRMLPSFLSVGAGLVILGMAFDLVDGLLARATRSATNFGGQLDSLADFISFGIAPATLMVALLTKELAGDAILPSPISASFWGRITWVAAAVYVAFTAVRLARFNVEHAKAGFDYRTFRGLPSPAAAGVVVAMVLFQDQPVGLTARVVTVYAMPVAAVVIAFLMVSRIPYRRWHRAYLLGRKPFSQFVAFILLFAVFWSFKAPMLLLLALWYAISGPVFLLIRWLRERRAAPSLPTSETNREAERKWA